MNNKSKIIAKPHRSILVAALALVWLGACEELPADEGNEDELEAGYEALEGLAGVWRSEAEFLDSGALVPAFERLAELNPGYDGESAREFWKAFRHTDWVELEIAAPELSFRGEGGSRLCQGEFAPLGVHPVRVNAWASDPERHPEREVPVNVFEFVGDPSECEEQFSFVWVLGMGDHGHMRYASSFEELVATMPWWPTPHREAKTSGEFAEEFSELVERLEGALPQP
jgi:hypothetical protein